MEASRKIEIDAETFTTRTIEAALLALLPDQVIYEKLRACDGCLCAGMKEIGETALALVKGPGGVMGMRVACVLAPDGHCAGAVHQMLKQLAPGLFARVDAAVKRIMQDEEID